MPLSPRRRRRALQAHQLRSQGLSLRQIAQHLRISHTSVHHDLLALETDWPEIAQTAANELTMSVVQLFQHRLQTLAREGPLGPFKGIQNLASDGAVYPAAQLLNDAAIIRLHELHDRALRNAAGQLLQAAKQLNNAAANPTDTAAEPDAPLGHNLPYPLEELADADINPEQPLPEPTLDAPNHTLTAPIKPNQRLTNPTTPNHPQPPRPDRTTAPTSPNTIPGKVSTHPPPSLATEEFDRRLAERSPDLAALREHLNNPEAPSLTPEQINAVVAQHFPTPLTARPIRIPQPAAPT